MGKARESASARVLAGLLDLTIRQQWSVITKARDHGKNAIAELYDRLHAEIGSISMDEMIASHEGEMAKREVRQMKVKRASGASKARAKKLAKVESRRQKIAACVKRHWNGRSLNHARQLAAAELQVSPRTVLRATEEFLK